MSGHFKDIQQHSIFIPLTGLSYLLALVYGSLYPWQNWQLSEQELSMFAASLWPRYITETDVLTNVLLYIPFGLFASILLLRKLPVGLSLLVAMLSGILLSLSLEITQMFLPARISSLLDAALNSSGVVIGCFLALLTSRETTLGQACIQIRYTLFWPGRLYDVGLSVLVLWMLSQLIPLFPSVSKSNLEQALGIIRFTVSNPDALNITVIAGFTLAIAGLGFLFQTVIKENTNSLIMFSLFTLIVLLLQIPVISRALTLESIIGLIIGLLVYGALMRREQKQLVLYASCCIVSYVVLDRVLHSPGPHPSDSINWIPFKSQMHTLTGFAEISNLMWPYIALAYLSMHTRYITRNIHIFWGMLFVLCFSLFLEWIHTFVTHSPADITAILLAVAGWLLPWTYTQTIRWPSLASRH